MNSFTFCSPSRNMTSLMNTPALSIPLTFPVRRFGIRRGPLSPVRRLNDALRFEGFDVCSRKTEVDQNILGVLPELRRWTMERRGSRAQLEGEPECLDPTRRLLEFKNHILVPDLRVSKRLSQIIDRTAWHSHFVQLVDPVRHRPLGGDLV